MKSEPVAVVVEPEAKPVLFEPHEHVPEDERNYGEQRQGWAGRDLCGSPAGAAKGNRETAGHTASALPDPQPFKNLKRFAQPRHLKGGR
jgi:hypothetical protein